MKRAIPYFVIIVLSIFISMQSKAQTKTIVLDNKDSNNLRAIGIEVRQSDNDSLFQIEGIISDNYTREGISFATVVFSQNGTVITGVVCDLDGHFSFSAPRGSFKGSFDLAVSSLWYDKLEIKYIPAIPAGKYYMEFELKKGYLPPLVRKLRESKEIIDIAHIDTSSLYMHSWEGNHTFKQGDIRHMPY